MRKGKKGEQKGEEKDRGRLGRRGKKQFPRTLAQPLPFKPTIQFQLAWW